MTVYTMDICCVRDAATIFIQERQMGERGREIERESGGKRRGKGEGEERERITQDLGIAQFIGSDWLPRRGKGVIYFTASHSKSDPRNYTERFEFRVRSE